MDQNSTRRERQPTGVPPAQAAPAEAPIAETPRSGRRRPRSDRPSSQALDLRLIIAIPALALVVMIAIVIIATGGILGTGAASPSLGASNPAATSSAATSPTASTHPTAAATPSSPASPTFDSPTPSPVPAAVPLPALLGAIGDSYTQAWGVSPAYPGDHSQFSWVVGTDPNDGVLSLLERFRALGGSPSIVAAATSGKKMDDATRQANLVVAAAKKLGPGKTAYVTFELGTNDLCASPDPMTDPVEFGAQLQTAVVVLRAGLPAGSRILMLSVPDFPHFREITQADPTAKATLAMPKNANRCAPYLGASSPSALAQGNDYLAMYDTSLKSACDDINAHGGTAGKIDCTYSDFWLADSDFTIADLSTADYFHPSLSGQAKMAEDAWQADAWALRRLSSAAAPRDLTAANSTADASTLTLAFPFLLVGLRRRRPRDLSRTPAPRLL